MIVADRVGFKLAWRVWIYQDDMLTSFNGTVWQPKQRMGAECLGVRDILNQPVHRGEPAPGLTCSCGIYAVKRALPSLSPYYGQLRPTCAVDGPTILGTVALWGKIVIHEDGYRAQFAYPWKLYTSADPKIYYPGLLKYGVPIVSLMQRNRLKGESDV